MIIDCISDLHGCTVELQGGDLLVIPGDMTARDEHGQWEVFRRWMQAQNYRKKVIVPGNHDNRLVETLDGPMWQYYTEGAEMLIDRGIEFEGLKIWGSPWTLSFPGMNRHCMAFTVHADEQLEKKWDLIPKDTDILVTHGPPYGILDYANFHCVGSRSLYRATQRIKPKLHVFGHVHECYGELIRGGIKYINCSILDQPNVPIRIIL